MLTASRFSRLSLDSGPSTQSYIRLNTLNAKFVAGKAYFSAYLCIERDRCQSFRSGRSITAGTSLSVDIAISCREYDLCKPNENEVWLECSNEIRLLKVVLLYTRKASRSYAPAQETDSAHNAERLSLIKCLSVTRTVHFYHNLPPRSVCFQLLECFRSIFECKFRVNHRLHLPFRHPSTNLL